MIDISKIPKEPLIITVNCDIQEGVVGKAKHFNEGGFIKVEEALEDIMRPR